MEIFSSKTSQDRLDLAFQLLDQITSACSNIFCDTLANQPLREKPLVGFSSNAINMTGDLSAIVRQEDHPALSAMGVTTAFSSIQGAIALTGAINDYQEAEKFHDANGKWLSRADIVSRISQIFGGLGFSLVRFADVANRGFNSLKMLTIPAAMAVTFSVQCLGMLYAGLAVWGALSLYENNAFLTRLKKAQGNEEELKSLIEELVGKSPIPISKKIDEKDVYNHLGLELRAMLSEIDPKLVAKLSDETLGKALFDPGKEYGRCLTEVLDRIGIPREKEYTVHSLMGNQNLIRFIWNKEKSSIHHRILGSKGVDLIGRAAEMRLSDLLSSSDPSIQKYAKATVQKLLSELKTVSESKRHVMIAFLITGVLGTVFTVLSSAIQGTGIALASSVGFFVSFLTMAYGDGLCFWEDYQSGALVGEYGKFYIALHLALGIVAIATAIAITVVTGGIFPIAAIVLIGSVWIAMDVWVYFLLSKREENQEIDHPKAETLLKELQAHRSPWIHSKTMEMLHKMPKLQRRAILGTLNENEPLKEIYARGLKTFKEQNLLETKEKREQRIYLECLEEKDRYKKTLEKAFALTNERLLIQENPLDENSLSAHPCSSIFYNIFYDELSKSEQIEFCRKIGKEKLQKAVESLLNPPAFKEISSKIAFAG